MNFLYSAGVVAPMHRSTSRASAGFKMFAASSAPPPAPTSVWSSSMKRTRSRSADASATILTSASSKSPRNFAVAASAPMTSSTMRSSRISSGASSSTARRASPSTTAVFPTPASPTSTGLLFCFRRSARITCFVSASRPRTGSIRPSRASCVRSFEKRSSVGVGGCGLRSGALGGVDGRDVARASTRTSPIFSRTSRGEIFDCARKRFIASSRCFMSAESTSIGSTSRSARAA